MNNHTHILLLHCPCGLAVGYHVALEDTDWEDIVYISQQAARAMTGEYECPRCALAEVFGPLLGNGEPSRNIP